MNAIRLGLIVLAAGGWPLAAGCRERPDETGKVVVAATIFPLADVVEQVGGAHVAVTCIVPPGITPHGFELNPAARRALARAALVVSAGPTDDWLRPRMVGEGAETLRLADLAEEGHDDGDDHADHDEHAGHDGDHDHADPHYWLNPNHVATLAEAVGEALAELDADHADDYRANAARYARQCRKLAKEMQTAAGAFTHKAFIAEHPAYGVLAELMGLRQIASVRPVVGAPLTPAHRRELIRQAVEMKVPVIFTERQLSGDEAEAIRAAAAAEGWTLKLGELDPIGNPSDDERRTYLANMRANLAALKEGLSD